MKSFVATGPGQQFIYKSFLIWMSIKITVWSPLSSSFFVGHPEVSEVSIYGQIAAAGARISNWVLITWNWSPRSPCLHFSLSRLLSRSQYHCQTNQILGQLFHYIVQTWTRNCGTLDGKLISFGFCSKNLNQSIGMTDLKWWGGGIGDH